MRRGLHLKFYDSRGKKDERDEGGEVGGLKGEHGNTDSFVKEERERRSVLRGRPLVEFPRMVQTKLTWQVSTTQPAE